MADEPAAGHVSAGRLYGPGAAAFRSGVPEAAEAGPDCHPQPQQAEQPRLTLDEALDARAACSSVHPDMRDDSMEAASRLQQDWPHLRPGETAPLADLLEDFQRTEETAREKEFRRLAYRRTQMYATYLKELAGVSVKGSQESSSSSSDNEAVPEKLWRQRRPDLPFWTCVNHCRRQRRGQPSSLQACSHKNQFTKHHCAVCGAARWDGPDGQLQACVNAAFQTADLDTTSTTQLAARVHFFSRSKQGAGLELPDGAVKAEVRKHLRRLQPDRNLAEVRKDSGPEQHEPEHNLMSPGLLPLPENEIALSNFPDNPGASRFTFPASCHRPQASKQRDTFAALQTAIMDLSSDIKHASKQPGMTASSDANVASQPSGHRQNLRAAEIPDQDDMGIANELLEGAEPENFDDPHSGHASLERAVQSALQNHEASADADGNAAAEFARGLLRQLMIEAQDYPQLS